MADGVSLMAEGESVRQRLDMGQRESLPLNSRRDPSPRCRSLEGFRLRLWLTDSSVVERDVPALLTGPIFDAVRNTTLAR
jgi:hypothetical protein